MEVSSQIQRAAIQIKRLEELLKKQKLSGSAIKKKIIDAMQPLYKSTQELSSSLDPPKYDLDIQHNFHIYTMIIQYLADNGAIKSAKTLIQEMPYALILEEEINPISVYKIYNPWREELLLPMEESMQIKSNTSQKVKEIQEAGRIYIEKREEEAATKKSYYLQTYQIVQKYIKKRDSSNMEQEKICALEEAISKIKKILYPEEASLICVDQNKFICISVHSQEYKDVLACLSMIVTPLHRFSVQQTYKKHLFSPQTCTSLPLSLLYFVGKKMENININPYNQESEPIESGAPSCLAFHSSFFCPVLRSECTIENFPCILTCGHVISTRALEKIAMFRGSPFKCPYCPKDIHLRDVYKLKLLI
ncbi:hypothetical protein NEFER03_1003 [Nematocida sp. LUAm3]|nr:hypothetical protein NEFER03_1003 [Nematocida sp. LUAm3]KAI5175393.1 hypothetical protein NEFER02_1322 [Nematocida sp. LUAm2]KAI5177650.1 hypothetical protein NEFER01_0874 [Nematocida sp. LUAm1]